MDEAAFATSIDAHRVVIRPVPETALVVLPFRDPDHVQIVIDQPARWPALLPSEGSGLRPYFEWDDDSAGFWWRTLRPAVFALERLGRGVWAGRLLERGTVVPAGDDPSVRPTDDEHLFAVFRQIDPTNVRDPRSPVFARDARGHLIPVYSAKATRIVRAYFPTSGPEHVWLRTFISQAERPAHRHALDQERAVLTALHASAPGSVPEILHAGALNVSDYVGRYVALAPCAGLPPATWFGEERRTMALLFGESFLIELILGVCRVARAAHSAGLCLGPLTPGILRTRPAFVDGRPGLRVMLIALPGSGPPTEILTSHIKHLFPDEDDSVVSAQLAHGYERSVASDLRGIGHLILALLRGSGEDRPYLSEVAAKLQTDHFHSVQQAEASIGELL